MKRGEGGRYASDFSKLPPSGPNVFLLDPTVYPEKSIKPEMRIEQEVQHHIMGYECQISRPRVR